MKPSTAPHPTSTPDPNAAYVLPGWIPLAWFAAALVALVTLGAFLR